MAGFSIGGLLGGIGDVITRDAGHAINLGSDLLTNQGFHGSGTSLGNTLINDAHSNSNNPGVFVNLAAHPTARTTSTSQPQSPSSSGQVQTDQGGSGGGTNYSAATGGTGGSSSTSSAPAPSQLQLAYNNIINQLTGQINSDQGYQQQGLNNIDTANNNAIAQEGQRDQTAIQSNQTQRENNIGSINQDASQVYNSLMQILGRAGQGGSSAALYNVPYAVSQNASGQRAGADYTYNANATNERNTHAENLNSIDSQTATNKQNFLQQLQSNIQGLQTQLGNAEANASYAGANVNQGMIDNTNNSIAHTQSVINQLMSQYTTPTYQAPSSPSITSWTLDPTTVNAQAANPNGQASTAPYLQSATNQKNASGNILTGNGK